jgi:hypothetical protein
MDENLQWKNDLILLITMYYALKENSELCVLWNMSNEHARNVDAKFTHNAKCLHL